MLQRKQLYCVHGKSSRDLKERSTVPQTNAGSTVRQTNAGSAVRKTNAGSRVRQTNVRQTNAGSAEEEYELEHLPDDNNDAEVDAAEAELSDTGDLSPLPFFEENAFDETIKEAVEREMQDLERQPSAGIVASRTVVEELTHLQSDNWGAANQLTNPLRGTWNGTPRNSKTVLRLPDQASQTVVTRTVRKTVTTTVTTKWLHVNGEWHRLP